MMFDWGWLQRRWWDFRYGHSTYLAFLLSFTSFIVINYNLLGVFQHLFPNIIYFAATFLVTYPPIAIIVGYKFHRKKQLPTDQEIATLANPFLYKAQPGKETLLNLPLQKLLITLNIKLWKRFHLLTEEEECCLNKYLSTIDSLMQGETLKNA